METLLIVAIVVTALSVVVQAGALLGMYLLSRRTTEKVNNLVEESHKLMGPLESVATNFKSTSNVLVDVSKDARAEVNHIRGIVTETEVGRLLAITVEARVEAPAGVVTGDGEISIASYRRRTN